MAEKEEKNIHILTKKIGETPLECVWRYKKEYPEFVNIPMTYAGRLDPMAEGILLVLSGDAIKEKEKYLNFRKTYEFEILWECATDTGDILGVVSSDDLSIFPKVSDVEEYVKNSTEKFEQVYPAYSSQPAEGPSLEGGIISKPLIQWSREGRISEVKIPSHEVEIFDTEYISRRFENGKDLLQKITSNISLVKGDFRQEKILAEWKKILGPHPDREYAIDIVRLDVSGGFYVRQFVIDLAKKFDTKALTYHILRTVVGEYTVDK